jgi:hypothetical protein
MSYLRRQSKRDKAEPGVVDALEAAGVRVYRELPVDLLVHRSAWGPGWYRCLEVKTPGEPKHSKGRCEGQDEFIAETGCPVVKTPTEALDAVTGVKP